MNILESKRIWLKPLERTDLFFMGCLRNNADINKWIINNPLTPESQTEWFTNLSDANIFIIKEVLPSLYNNENQIGTIGIFSINHLHRTGRWNLRIMPEYWRKGFATEAIKLFLYYVFNTLNINKLMGDCFAENIAEVNLLTKLGFVNEGTWREHYFHRGKFRDSIQFTMLKSDYDKQTAQGNLLVDNS